MYELEEYTEKVFEDIKHFDENENEYWNARELMLVLEYKEWRKFEHVIIKAINACSGSDYNLIDQFVLKDKMINIGKGGKRKVKDYKLSRLACYLIAQNCNPRIKVIALGQTYFAKQTRKQELFENKYKELSEDEKRLFQRNRTREENKSLNVAALNAGVKNFDRFHNAGYKGLYNGETANDIAKRKNLRYREDILDNMCSEELAANLFRITLIEQKLKNENINNSKDANDAQFNVGKDIREDIIRHNGILPEKYPTPIKSIKEIKKSNKCRLKDK